mmetsp:Transcript_5481/g.13307  ORF Transcript_5481/g.13307 Transcript_5481/m.13307 type:complete len:208 (+) Transcript_5481:2637-3260(+)
MPRGTTTEARPPARRRSPSPSGPRARCPAPWLPPAPRPRPPPPPPPSPPPREQSASRRPPLAECSSPPLPTSSATWPPPPRVRRSRRPSPTLLQLPPTTRGGLREVPRRRAWISRRTTWSSISRAREMRWGHTDCDTGQSCAPDFFTSGAPRSTASRSRAPCWSARCSRRRLSSRRLAWHQNVASRTPEAVDRWDDSTSPSPTDATD